ncbi:OPT-domain-containing protein [Exidia glandulosa HHB12029]|uniref:OPT-domain-containing protein n=1 Tax=Exidia glandulosa HHB12029 TaxID=1314781 RepID=A0A165PN33_EXIGL|nr:OPT-domain-containing protein [Exidia glandulosa HHB12029]
MTSDLDVKRTPSSEKDSLDEKHAPAPDVLVLEADIQAIGADIEEAIVNAEKLTEEDVRQAAQDIVDKHSYDPNFPSKPLALARRFLDEKELRTADPATYDRLYQELRVEAALIVFNSPYPEVRAVVSNTDDPSIQASTFRAWFIGLIFVGAGAFINQFFSIRYPGISVGTNVAQLLAYPAGKLLERILPSKSVTIAGRDFSLNPGPFNMKEHMVITIMANVGFNAPYTNYVVFVQYIPRYFNMPWASNFGYQLLIALSTNYIGYGLAGLTRRFLVYPSHAIWYSNLATIALNRAFHSGQNLPANGWTISRMRYFLYCFVGMFVYFWFPSYIFQALSFFNWIVWIAPQNVHVAAITGSTGSGGGLGLNPLPTFDMNQFLSDPWINPFYSTMNWFAGTVITFPIIVACWYSNVWQTAYLPINSNGVFDNTGKRYNVSLAVDSSGLFDHEAFKSYSPAYLAASNILVYGFFFATYAATVSHAILYHRKEIIMGFKSLLTRTSFLNTQNDVHSVLMRKYKEVPEWWYFSVLVVSIGLGAAGVGAWPTSTTPAVVLYGVFLAMIFCIPIGVIYSTTNVSITLNVLAEFIGGAWFEGNALAMNFFKSYGYVTTAHTLTFAQDLKLAHYTHIAPRVTFTAQMVATLVSTFVSVGIVNFQFTIPDVCEPGQKDHFTCPGINTFFTASVLWGTLGPRRMFGVNAIYSGLVWCFLIGAALPVIFFYLGKRIPSLRSVHLPIVLTGGLIWAPYGLNNVWPVVPVAFLFNVFIKRRYLAWWSKYNYITTSAFTCAIAIVGVICFFALQFPGIEIDWVGNTKPFVDNCDADACRLKTLLPGEHFGPGVGEFE